MGAINCLEHCRAHEEHQQRLLVLHQGAEFKRKKFLLGITSGSERIYLRLNSDEHTLIWKQLDGKQNVNNFLVADVNVIKPNGTLGFMIVSQKGETLLDVEADSEAVRNEWLTNLQQLCEDNSDHVLESNSTFRQMIEEKKRKQAYWAERTQELEDRKKDAEERKKKFGTTGMKYTALAMSARSSIPKNND